jgi:TonB family protein
METPAIVQTWRSDPSFSPGTVCTRPYYQDATARNVIVPGYTGGLTGVAIVRVTVDPAGNVAATSIVQTSGSANLDKLAMDAARQSTYYPKMIFCQPLTGEYLYKVSFGT